MAFIVSDYWQGLGLGTKMVDYALDIAKQKDVSSVYAIMLQDNYRALSLTKKMGFTIEYLSDGTVKATLNLKNEDIDTRCSIIPSLNKPSLNEPSLPEPPQEQPKQEIPLSEPKKAREKPREATTA